MVYISDTYIIIPSEKMNRRYALLLLILIGFLSSGIAQVDSLYAVKEYLTGNTGLQLIRVSTATGQSVPLSPVYGISPILQVKPTMNPHTNTYNIVGYDFGLDSLANAGRKFLFSINVATGAMQSVEIDSLTVAIDFDCEANAFYYVSLDYNLEIARLHKYDVVTGAKTMVSLLPFFPIFNNGGMPQQYPFIDVVNKHMVIHGFPSLNSSGRHIYTVDLQTGMVLNDFAVVDPDAAHQLVYNVQDSSVYGIAVHFSPNQRSVVQVDQQSWGITPISASVVDLWYINQHAALISSNGEHLFFMGYDDATGFGYRINSFDLQTGMLSSSQTITNEYDIRYLCDFQGSCDFSTSLVEVIPQRCSLGEVVRAAFDGVRIVSDVALTSVELFDLKGDRLGAWQYSDQRSAEISLRDHASGMYLVVLKSEDCQVLRKIVW